MGLPEIIQRLSEPFPPEVIEWRVGSTSQDKKKGLALAYLTSRDVMDRLDNVVTPFGWQIKHEAEEGGKVTAHIGIKNPETGEWIYKSDGAGATDVEGDKGSYSDATKRAAVLWGIGRYLYSIKSPWVSIVPFGRSYKIDDREKERLYSFLPNAGKCNKVTAPVGLSHKPAAFWEGSSLLIALKKDFADEAIKNNGTWSPEAWKWWKEQFSKGVDKAPSRDLLAKFQEDNQHILDQLPSEETMALCEACAIRAEQFKEYA